jgi:hypothetical protein
MWRQMGRTRSWCFGPSRVQGCCCCSCRIGGFCRFGRVRCCSRSRTHRSRSRKHSSRSRSSRSGRRTGCFGRNCCSWFTLEPKRCGVSIKLAHLRFNKLTHTHTHPCPPSSSSPGDEKYEVRCKDSSCTDTSCAPCSTPNSRSTWSQTGKAVACACGVVACVGIGCAITGKMPYALGVREERERRRR